MTSYYTTEELKEIGFAQVGEDVCISRKASIYGADKMVIGNHVRVDDFCILSGNICLNDYVHVAAYCALFGGNAGIVMQSFSGISSRSVIYAATDDYSGNALTNPTVSDEFRIIHEGKVTVGRHTLIGTGCTVLPGVTLEEGVSVGSMTLVNRSLEAWGIYVGIPAKYMKPRAKKILQLEEEFLQQERDKNE